MDSPEPNPPQLQLDYTGVALIVLLAVVVAPATMVASAWVLTDGFDFAGASWFELLVSALTCLLALYVMRAALRELAGGVGVRIDERGIARRGFELRWDEVETLEAPGFGLLDIGGKGKQLRLRTYLYGDRVAVLEYIARQTGKQVPEMAYSYK